MKHLLVMVGLVMVAGSQNQDPPRVGEPFSLKIGTSATLEGADLSLAFAELARDSRCPKGVQCVVAGEAVVVFEVSSANEIQKLTFEIPPGGGDEQRFGDFTIAILELQPEPVAGKRTERSSYAAEVLVTHDVENVIFRVGPYRIRMSPDDVWMASEGPPPRTTPRSDFRRNWPWTVTG